MGEIDDVINRAVDASIPHTEAFLDAVLEYVDKVGDLEKAQGDLYSMLTSKAGDKLTNVNYEALMRSSMLGALEVETQEKGRALGPKYNTHTNLPFDEAIDAFKKKKVMPRSDFDKLSFAQKQNAFTMAGLDRTYELKEVHSYLTDAIQNKMSLPEFKKGMRERFKTLGLTKASRAHIETVYRTNLIGQYQTTRYAQLQKAKKLRPYWEYHAVGDERTRPSHGAMSGRIYPVDDPIWQEWYPPNGFNCRCRVTSISKRELEREGGKVVSGPPTDPKSKKAYTPDKGWSGYPKSDKAGGKAADVMTAKVRKSKMLQGPELGSKGGVFRSTGDMLRSQDKKRVEFVDSLAGITRKEAERLIEETPYFGIYPGRLPKIPRGKTAIEGSLHSQNLETLRQLILRIAGDPEVAHLASSARLLRRASYVKMQPGIWSGAEMAHGFSLPGGQVLSRSTEATLHFVTANQTELAIMQDIMLGLEAGGEAAMRKAWTVGNLRIRGAGLKENDQMISAILNRRKMGSGEQVVMTLKKRLPGFKHEAILVNRKLASFLI